MKRLPRLGMALAALLTVVILGGCLPSRQTFVATFASSSDLNRFDFGFSGQSPLTFTDPGNLGITDYMGDHNQMCSGPDQQRAIHVGGSKASLDFSQMFWWCAPGGSPSAGHLMTGVNTVGYNIAWFSPKPVFNDVTGACWDINETNMSRRKWTQVLFVDDADAHRYPVTPDETKAPLAPNLAPMPARGTGGFDLGFVSPEFSDSNGATTNIISGGIDGQHQTLRGFKESYGMTPFWFQDGEFTTPSFGGAGGRVELGGLDKATRYTHCIWNDTINGQDVVHLAEMTPDGRQDFDMPGHIPTGKIRVVFEDDNYNPPKDEPPENPDGTYSADRLTWHWDNVKVFTDANALQAAIVALH